MTTKTLSFKSLPSLVIAEGATTPNPGAPGVWAWSQTLTKPVFWDGTSWTAGSAAPTWIDYASGWTTAPAQVGAATVSGQSGQVLVYTLGGVTRYRFVPDSYSPSLDGFYSEYSGGMLSGLIVSRG